MRDQAAWNRRAVLGSLAGTFGMATVARPAWAQAPTIHKVTVGAIEITVISDGTLDLPPAFVLPGRDPADAGKLFEAEGKKFEGFRSEVNVAIIRTGNDLILIDTGAGPDFMPTLGKFFERFEAAGIKQDAITKVLFTHAHADHLWGVVDPLGGDTLFEKAEHLMTATEFGYWMQADIETKVAESFRGMAAGTNRRLKALAPRIKQIATGSEIAPGIQIIDTAGHTPGHASVLVKSGSEQLLIGGDVLTQAIVSFAEPGWRWGPDMDPDKAGAARKRTLDMLATEKIRLLGYHLPWPGVGHVERKGTAFRFAQA